MRKRNPIIAGLLSILILGFGQLYNGQLKRATMFVLLFIPLLFFIGFSGLFKSFNGFLISLFLIFAYMAFVAFDAIKHAIRPQADQPASQYGLKHYAAYLIGWYLFAFLFPPVLKKITGYETLAIPTPNMAPSIMVGDVVMATRIRPDEVAVGDIVTFKKEDGENYISRVIGLPGQQIEVIDNKVYINGQSETWQEAGKAKEEGFEYQKYKSMLPTGKPIEIQNVLKFRNMEMSDWKFNNQPKLIVPNNQVFLLGDNRGNSMDSRMYGTISLDKVEKKVHYIWWSDNKQRIGLKLD